MDEYVLKFSVHVALKSRRSGFRELEYSNSNVVNEKKNKEIGSVQDYTRNKW